MSRDCTEASVLTQQTVLGFSTHPPSPFGAASLPQCVTEQRGRQHSFAMNQHTQLQFNLGIPSHPTNLATHFDPSRPSPVIIEKPSFVHGVNGREFRAISAKKLALAVRLAKRDLRLRQFQPPTPSSPQHCPVCRDEQSVQSTVQCDGKSVYIQEPQTPTQTDVMVRDTEDPLPQKTPCPSNKQSVSVPEMALSLVDKEGNQRRRDDRSSQEVLRLRKELQRQVAYIKELCELGRGLGHVTSAQRVNNNKRGRGRVRVVESGRVWMEEVRGEEEKLLQREEEQAARNARTIYNLSHQLSRLQQDLQRLQLNESPDSIKKTGAIRRLATIYRSALRLLQNYQSPGHTPQPLPQELALLLQHLSLLSHHFGVGGAKSELETTLKQLQELVEQGKENESIARQPVWEKVAMSRKPAMQKQNKVRNAKKTTVFSHPQLVPRSVQSRRGRGKAGQQHFAQQTLSSQRRQQQPKQTAIHSPLKHSMPTLMHSSTPFTVQSEGQKERQHRSVLQSAKKQQMEPLLNRNHTSPLTDAPLCDRTGEDTLNQATSTKATSRTVSSIPLRTDVSIGDSSSRINGQRESTSAPSLEMRNKMTPKIALNSPVDGEQVPADADISPAGVVDEQRLWMENISAMLAHHSQQLETFKKSTEKQLGQLQQSLPSQKKTGKKNKDDITASPVQQCEEEEEENGSFDGRKLEGLMERLRELEGEEEVIRERWRTIAYEDPPLARPPILHGSEECPLAKNASSPPPSIPEEALQRITSYRQQFQHHLQMTGHSTQGGFNPWNMAEKLADELLSEVVDQVAGELGELCDGYVDRLFSSEFVKPPSPTHSDD